MMVYRIEGREILIVHKIRKKVNGPDPDPDKGDNSVKEKKPTRDGTVLAGKKRMGWSEFVPYIGI